MAQSPTHAKAPLLFYRFFSLVYLPVRLCIFMFFGAFVLLFVSNSAGTLFFKLLFYGFSSIATLTAIIGLPRFTLLAYWSAMFHLVSYSIFSVVFTISYGHSHQGASDFLILWMLAVLLINSLIFVYLTARRSLFSESGNSEDLQSAKIFNILLKIVETFKSIGELLGLIFLGVFGSVIFCLGGILPIILLSAPGLILDTRLPIEMLYEYNSIPLFILFGVLDLFLKVFSLFLAFLMPIAYLILTLLSAAAFTVYVPDLPPVLNILVYAVLTFDCIYPFVHQHKEKASELFNNTKQKVKKYFQKSPTPEELERQEALRREQEQKLLEQEKEKQRLEEEKQKRQRAEAKIRNERQLMYGIAHMLPVAARTPSLTFLEPEEDLRRKEQLRIDLEVKTLEELAGVSLDISFDKNDLPIDHQSSGTYGLFTVYYTYSGKCYHSSKTCCAYVRETHMFTAIANGLMPCMNCSKGYPRKIPEWYMNYCHILQDKRTYNL